MSFSHINIACYHKVAYRQMLEQYGLVVSPTDVKVLNYLSHKDHGTGYVTIWKELGMNTRFTVTSLRHLEAQDMITRDAGRYEITVHGRATLQKLDHLLGELAHKSPS